MDGVREISRLVTLTVLTSMTIARAVLEGVTTRALANHHEFANPEAVPDATETERDAG